MLKDFQLVAITKLGRTTRLLQIPLYQGLQDALAQSWQDQYHAFVDDIQEIDFDAGYILEQHERFRLKNYELPTWLADEDSETVSSLETITKDDSTLDATKGIVAFARNGQGEELILFQNFNRSHIIRPGRFLLLERGTYKSMQHSGLTLDSKLSAVFLPIKKTLLFHSFRTANTFLPLADFYEEASNVQIREILNHDCLVLEDAEAHVTGANHWFRKRFAMLQDSNILDEYTVREIVDRSVGHEVNIQLDGDQIVFPADRAQAKRLLQFLNEEIFRGAITETLYETNSKREAD